MAVLLLHTSGGVWRCATFVPLAALNVVAVDVVAVVVVAVVVVAVVVVVVVAAVVVVAVVPSLSGNSSFENPSDHFQAHQPLGIHGIL